MRDIEGLENKCNWTASEVRQKLENGEEVSTLQQASSRGGWRLSAVIYSLKQRFELPIVSYTKKGFGGIAFYRLVEDTKPAQLDLFGVNNE